ncbi:MAG: DUF11 domain-containing protein, partial [Acidobacteria bacterium]|nr:DUF11 domain-containing protein [Acidobacteriota bacterium]
APAPAALNSNLTYTLRVTNNGELNATNVRLNDVLPSGATFVSVASSQGTCTGTATVNCNLGNLNVGAVATVTIVIQPPGRLTISNVAEVTANEPDGNLPNNRVTVESNVNFYDLAVSVGTSSTRVAPGGKVYYLVNIANRNGAPVNDVVLRFTLPSGLTVVSCIPEFGTCGGTGNNRTVAMAQLAAQQSRAVTFTALVNNSTTAGSELIANAAVEPLAADANPANNTATARFAVTAAPLLAKANGKITYAIYNGFEAAANGAFEMNEDGSAQRRLPDLGSEITWSPDGARVAYFVWEDRSTSNNLSLFVSPIEGTNKVRLAADASFVQGGRFSWSPDGTKIVYVTSSNQSLALAQTDGSGTLALLNLPTGVSDPDWSPDGERLAFIKLSELWTVNLDGTELKRLTTNRPFTNDTAARPRWSPDGTKLLVTYRGNTHLMNADGTGLTRAFNVLSSGQAAWSPDGKKIVFVSPRPIYSINYDGTDLRQLTMPQSIHSEGFTPHWQPLPASGNVMPLPNLSLASITGKVTDEEGLPFAAAVQITGTVSGTATLGEQINNAVGQFTGVRLLRGGNYTLTPQHPAYRFEPVSRTYNNLTSDITGADFKAIFRPLAIRGRITDSNGAPMSGVPINISSTFPPQTETDENGHYAFTNLFGGVTYGIFPTGYGTMTSFEPRFIQFDSLDENKTLNFVGRRDTFEVNGIVKTATGNPLAGATVTLSGNNTTRTATTNNEGQARFAEVTGGFVYALRASQTGASFAPSEQRIIINRPTSVTFFSGATTVAAVSAASYRATDVTAGGIVALFGTGLATTSKAAATQPLPTELEGVSVTASAPNFEKPCPLFFVSPQQINLLLPAPDALQLPPTELSLTVRRAGAVVAVTYLRVRSFAPSLFSANATGQGLAAAVALRVKADGSQVYEPITRFDPMLNRLVPIPLDVSNAREQVFLVLFGTGIGPRLYFRSEVFTSIANQPCEVLYAGRQGTLEGLDQVNVLLPRTLAGRGEADIVLTTPEGGAANVVKVNLK